MEHGYFRKIFEKILKRQISWNSVQWEPSCSMRNVRTDEWTDGQTDVAKLILAFRDIANGTKSLWKLVSSARKYSPK